MSRGEAGLMTAMDRIVLQAVRVRPEKMRTISFRWPSASRRFACCTSSVMTPLSVTISDLIGHFRGIIAVSGNLLKKVRRHAETLHVV